MKFIWLDTPGGGRTPVNPDQVTYLRPSPRDEGATRLVFGAGVAGLHELEVLGDVETVAKALEKTPAPPPFVATWGDREITGLEALGTCGEPEPAGGLEMTAERQAAVIASAAEKYPAPPPEPPARPERPARRKKGARAQSA